MGGGGGGGGGENIRCGIVKGMYIGASYIIN